MSINNIPTSHTNDVENQLRKSSHRELEIDSSPVPDIENQLRNLSHHIIKPTAVLYNPGNAKKVTINELYNVNKSFNKYSPPSHLLSPSTTVDTKTGLLKQGRKSTTGSYPLSWAEYKRTHLSPDTPPSNSHNGYFPGGSTRKKKRNSKRKTSKRKTNKKRKRNAHKKSRKK